ncbi:response regulator transcription factor [Bradyrhizobium sp. 41S5]|uniref:response regulator n=1 Tax=Bradyrhizobium sp. 41S5 TaxID=1404443 RepID=UPI00156A8BA4|nr:response regulator transcription factor [Bradyrhizobium sp. 41S5]UFX48294.1 response regulator transcription factor [Bradyrhizobium sp. 41S5]
MKRIVIADDHEIVRSGLRAIIEVNSDWTVSGEAANGEQAVAMVLETRPDIVIVDYSMPLINGLEVSRRLKTLRLRTEILLLTMYENEELLTEAIVAGIRGFLFKSDASKHLVSAIEALLDGKPYFTSILLEKLLHDYQVSKRSNPDMLLTSREQSVVQLIAEGHTNRSIGTILKLSVKTVETHRASAMRKLGLSSTADLVRYAIRKNMVEP